jgi:hypothetical protein
MSELLTELQRRRGEMETTELVSKLPPESLREADLVLGVLFNGYNTASVTAIDFVLSSLGFCCRSSRIRNSLNLF